MVYICMYVCMGEEWWCEGGEGSRGEVYVCLGEK